LIKNHFRNKRLFAYKKDRKQFIFTGMQNATSRAIRLISQLKQNMLDKDQPSIEIRTKQIRGMGLIPPSTIENCDRFIKDLTELK